MSEQLRDELTDKHEQIVLDALCEMFPEHSFDACYDIEDLMRHGKAALVQVQQERDLLLRQYDELLAQFGVPYE